MTWQALQVSGTSFATTPDSAALSISDNLDVRVRVAMEDWQGLNQTFAAKRQGGDEWQFRTRFNDNGRLSFTWWDTGGVATAEIADADVTFEDGTTHWVRVRRAGTSVFFYTSDDDTNDHTAVTWTQLGTTQTTPSGSIRSNVATHLTVGSAVNNGGEPLYGVIHAAAVVSNTTPVATPVFADPDEWTVGSVAGDTGTDAQGNVWTLGLTAKIIGDNLQGVAVGLQVQFGVTPFNQSQIWTDLTDDLRAADTSRGRSYELDRFDAGTMTTELENFDGKYNSHNTASPYYPNVRPMVPIRLRAVYEGTVYPIWAGFVQRWPVTFPGNIDSIARVESVDLFGPLSLADASQPDRTAVVEGLSPVAWWRFADETDSSVAGTHDLTFNGSPSSGELGAWTNDLGTLFDGTDDYATVASEGDVELLADMSIEMWFRPSISTTPTVETFSTPGSDTWTAPAHVRSVTVETWAGGGGGAAGVQVGASGGGGGGGAYARSTVAVTPGEVYDIQVGVGGTAGVDGFEAGSDGGISYFGDLLVMAAGGQGAPDHNGGAGGQASDSVGIKRSSGGRGGLGRANALVDDDPVEFGGGGGGGGGSGGFGAGGVGGTGGTGQESAYPPGTAGGLGGAGGTGLGAAGGTGGAATPTNGSAGTVPGGGGGGGGTRATSDGNGGAGAGGRVKLTYTTVENMTPFSVRGSTFLYHFHWDGALLRFGPAGNSAASYVVGPAETDVWHHVLVTVDWSGGSRIIHGYLDGVLTLDVSTGFQPSVEARAVNVGRRATDNDQYYQGDISEIVIYNTVLTAQDASALYAAQLEGFATQRTDERVEYVLTTAEVGVGVEINTGLLQEGQTVISGPNSPTDVSALEAIQIAAETEQGQFFIAADGRPVFHDRYHRLIDQATPVAAIDQADYVTLELYGKDERFIYNQIKVSPSDTADPFVVTDETSETEYGRRTLAMTTYPDDQNEGYDMAVYLLDLYKEPQDRIAAIHWEILEGVTPIDVVLGAEIGNRYTVTVPLAGDDLTVDVYLERISHTMTGIEPQQRWTVTWEVSPAGDAQAFWLLGVAGFSELGETTRIGF